EAERHAGTGEGGTTAAVPSDARDGGEGKGVRQSGPADEGELLEDVDGPAACIQGAFTIAAAIFDTAAGVDGNCRASAVDRMRQRRESADRARHIAPEGDCGPVGVRR